MRRGIFLSLFLVLFSTGCPATVAQNQVCFKHHCFTVEVVSKPPDLERGLQFRQTLAQDAGMLFVFSQSGKYSFWMKDTLLPLDIIWLDYARRVVHIEQNVQPCRQSPCPTYAPPQDALYVLELNANRAAQTGLHLGEVMEFYLKGFGRE